MLQAIVKSAMAAVKSTINKINMNQDDRIGSEHNQLVSAEHFSNVSTMAALSHKQVDVNNMKIYDARICSRAFSLQTKL